MSLGLLCLAWLETSVNLSFSLFLYAFERICINIDSYLINMSHHFVAALAEAGQALASRPDLLPSEYLDELQKLQDNVPTFGNDIAFHIVEKELKRKFGDVFELVEPEPVAGTLEYFFSCIFGCCSPFVSEWTGCGSDTCDLLHTSVISGEHRPSV